KLDTFAPSLWTQAGLAVNRCVRMASVYGSRTLKVEEAHRHGRRLRRRGADQRSGRARSSEWRPLGGEFDGWRTGSYGRGGAGTPVALARRRTAPHPGRRVLGSSATPDSGSRWTRWAIFV